LHIKYTDYYGRLNRFAVRPKGAINMWIDAGAFLEQQGIEVEGIAGRF
jgi:hypothetical protein